jgi:hypothetical protein
MPASQPTLQTKGSLAVGLKMDFNVSTYPTNFTQPRGKSVRFGQIVYGPPDEPPPPWTNGNQYSTGAGQAYGAMGMAPIYGPGYLYQMGAYYVMWIPDMSSNAVVTGKTYAFTFPLGSSNWIELYFRIKGGPNGSILLPGFGLWSLGSNPHAWTYVTPQEAYTGEWMIGLYSPASFAVMWLSAEYAPLKDYGSGAPQARLLFTCSGLTATSFYSSPHTADRPPSEPAEEPVGIQHLHERSHPHVLYTGPGIPVG